MLFAPVLTGALVAVLAGGFAQTAVPTPNDMGRSVAPLVDRVKGAVVTIQSTTAGNAGLENAFSIAYWKGFEAAAGRVARP